MLQSLSNRVPGLKDLRDNLLPPLLAQLGLDQLAQPLSSHILTLSSAGDSTTALERLFWWLIVLGAKNFLLVSNRSLPNSNLYPSPLSFPQDPLYKGSHHLLWSHPGNPGIW